MLAFHSNANIRFLPIPAAFPVQYSLDTNDANAALGSSFSANTEMRETD